MDASLFRDGPGAAAVESSSAGAAAGAAAAVCAAAVLLGDAPELEDALGSSWADVTEGRAPRLAK